MIANALGLLCDGGGVGNMSVWPFALATILIVVRGIYFSFTPLDVAPRKCPNCGGKTRYHDPFLMCDTCEMMVGVSIEAIWRDLRNRSPS